MPITLDDVLFGFLTPAAAALTVVFLVRRCLADDVGSRHAPSLALATGFCVGYWLLGLGPWSPQGHWHWLPYAVVLAAIIGPVVSVAGTRSGERLVVFALIAFVAAWQLVPNWRDVEPPRQIQIPIWVTIVAVSALLFETSTKANTDPLLPAILLCVCIAAAMVMVLAGSGRFGQIAIAGAGAIAGVGLSAVFSKQSVSLSGMTLGYFVFLCGLMWTGFANSHSEVPFLSYVFVPLSPTVYALCRFEPLSRFVGPGRDRVRAALSLAPSAIAVFLAMLNSEFGGIG